MKYMKWNRWSAYDSNQHQVMIAVCMCCLATTQQIDTAAHTTWPNRPYVQLINLPPTICGYTHTGCAPTSHHTAHMHTCICTRHAYAYSRRYWKAPDDVYPCLHLNEQPQCCLASGWFILCALFLSWRPPLVAAGPTLAQGLISFYCCFKLLQCCLHLQWFRLHHNQVCSKYIRVMDCMSSSTR